MDVEELGKVVKFTRQFAPASSVSLPQSIVLVIILLLALFCSMRISKFPECESDKFPTILKCTFGGLLENKLLDAPRASLTVITKVLVSFQKPSYALPRLSNSIVSGSDVSAVA